MPTTAPIKVPLLGQDLYSKEFNKLVGKARKMGRAVSATGRKLTTGLTMPIIGLGAMSIRTGIQFDDSMRKVQAKANVAGVSMDQLRRKAKDLGETTKFKASDAADGMDKLAMAGWDTNKIFEGIGPTLDLAAASGTELALTADVMSDTMGAFRIEAGKAGMVADVMAATLTGANVDMETFKDSMKYAAPIAKSYGMELKETSAIIGFLGNVGIKGSQAGTGLKKMMIALTSKASDGAKKLKKLGVAVEDGAGNMRGMVDILDDMGDRMKGMTRRDILNSMKTIFGERAVVGASAMADSLAAGDTSLKKLVRNLNELQPGKARAMAEIMEGGAGGAWRRTVSAFEGLQIAFMESGLLDQFSKFLKKLADGMRSLAQSDPDFLKKIAKGALALAAVGPALMMLGSLTNTITGLTAAVGAAGGLGAVMAAVTGPIGWAVAAIAGAIAAVIYFWDELESVRNAITGPFKDAFSDLGESFAGVGGQAGSFGQSMKDITKFFSDAIAPLVRLAIRFSPLMVMFRGLILLLRPIIRLFGTVVKIVGVVGSVFKWVGSAAGLLWEKLSTLADGWRKSAVAGSWFHKMIIGIVDAVKWAIDGIGKLWNMVDNFFGGISDSIDASADKMDKAADRSAWRRGGGTFSEEGSFGYSGETPGWDNPDEEGMSRAHYQTEYAPLKDIDAEFLSAIQEGQSKDVALQIQFSGLPEGMSVDVKSAKGAKTTHVDISRGAIMEGGI